MKLLADAIANDDSNHSSERGNSNSNTDPIKNPNPKTDGDFSTIQQTLDYYSRFRADENRENDCSSPISAGRPFKRSRPLEYNEEQMMNLITHNPLITHNLMAYGGAAYGHENPDNDKKRPSASKSTISDHNQRLQDEETHPTNQEEQYQVALPTYDNVFAMPGIKRTPSSDEEESEQGDDHRNDFVSACDHTRSTGDLSSDEEESGEEEEIVVYKSIAPRPDKHLSSDEESD